MQHTHTRTHTHTHTHTHTYTHSHLGLKNANDLFHCAMNLADLVIPQVSVTSHHNQSYSHDPLPHFVVLGIKITHVHCIMHVQ